MTIKYIAGIYLSTFHGFTGRGRTAHEAILSCLYDMEAEGVITY